MSDAAAFEAKIRENPADRAPYLVYADWLRDRWQDDRAEFIRLQIEREDIEAIEHRCPKVSETQCPACGASCYADDLRQQERELLFRLSERIAVPVIHSLWPGVSCGVEWDGEVRSSPGGIHIGSIRFMRGLVGDVHLDVDDYFRCAAMLFAAHPITHVRVTDAAIYSSGGPTYYLGDLGRFPEKYWRSLEGHKSRSSVRMAASRVCVAHGRKLAGLPPLVDLEGERA